MKYSLQALELNVHIGITPEERAEPQMLLCDVDFEVDSSKAQKTDDLADTIDYQEVYDAVKKFGDEQEWNLVEKLHADIKTSLEEAFKISHVRVALTKFPFEDGAIMIQN